MLRKSFDTINASLTLALEVDLLSSNAEAAARAFEAALTEVKNFKVLILDLRKCAMVDSVGLNLVFSLLTRSKERGSEVKILIAKGYLERIVQVAQLAKLFKVEVA